MSSAWNFQCRQDLFQFITQLQKKNPFYAFESQMETSIRLGPHQITDFHSEQIYYYIEIVHFSKRAQYLQSFCAAIKSAKTRRTFKLFFPSKTFSILAAACDLNKHRRAFRPLASSRRYVTLHVICHVRPVSNRSLSTHWDVEHVRRKYTWNTRIKTDERLPSSSGMQNEDGLITKKDTDGFHFNEYF